MIEIHLLKPVKIIEEVFISLPEEIKNHILRYQKEEDRNRSFTCWNALMSFLEKRNIKNPEFVFGEQGKPYLKGNEIYFSLSHSGEYCLLGIFDSPIGVDIQEMRDIDHRKLGERYFNKKDLDRSSFYSLWSKKEAEIKCDGKGLSLGFIDIKGIYSLNIDAPRGYAIGVASTKAIKQNEIIYKED